MFDRLSSDDNRDRWSSPLWERIFQAPTQRDSLRLTQGDRTLVDDTSAPPQHTLLQYDPERLPCGFLPVIKDWGSQGFASILSFSELPSEGQLHKMYSHGVGFQIFFLCFSYVLQNQGFYSGWSANPAIKLLIESDAIAGGHPQTQLGTIITGAILTLFSFQDLLILFLRSWYLVIFLIFWII